MGATVELQVLQPAPFVSRGGEKLAAALDGFSVVPAGRVCLDVGASTGGFTDCLLQRGAARVYALDVGRGQLAESLRGDSRVVSMERTHAAHLNPDAAERIRLPELVSLVVADVSFISLTRLLAGMAAAVSGAAPINAEGTVERPPIAAEAGGDIVALVKPQFELSPRDVPKGVVREAADRERAVERVRGHATALGLDALGAMESPLVGPAGNHEFFLHLRVPPGWHFHPTPGTSVGESGA